MSIELVPLCTATATLAEPIALPGTPLGNRVIFEVVDARLEGDRIRATMKGSAGADWLLAGPDGTGMLDVRVTVETDDGALVFIQYNGRTDVSGRSGSERAIYVAPRFETGDPRYAWLNTVQAIGKGTRDGNVITYEWFEAR